MTTTLEPLTEARQKAYDRYRRNVETGEAFRLHAASAQSAFKFGYHPVLDRGSWSYAMRVLAEMAERSDPMAQIATRILGHVNLYSTRPEAEARIYYLAEAALAEGYEDVVRKAGPEPGRPSSWHRDYSMQERVLLIYWLAEATRKMTNGVPGVGWAAERLAAEVGVHVPYIGGRRLASRESR